MIFNPSTNTPGKILQLPLIQPDKRQTVLDFISAARRIQDNEGADMVNDLLSRLDSAEATLRNMYKSLTIYRNQVPRIIRKLHNKEVSNK